MTLIRNGEPVADRWRSVADDQPVPERGPVLVSVRLWRRARAALMARPDPVGVRLAADDDLGDISADLEALALIAVRFPAATDGRGLTIARRLRGRYRYGGELRAEGGFVRDFFPFLERCGFDTIEARDEMEAAAWAEAQAVMPQPKLAG